MILLGAGQTLASPVNLVHNGGFEEGGTAENANIPIDWSFAPASFGLHNLNLFYDGSTQPLSHSGNWYYVFASTNPSGSYDTLAQAISTVPGQTYTLSFYINSTIPGGQQFFMASWDGQAVATSSNGDIGNQSYGQVIRSVTATTSSTILSFTGYNSSGAYRLDDISVLPIPEPATAVMMLLVGGLSALWRPRRKLA